MRSIPRTLFVPLALAACLAAPLAAQEAPAPPVTLEAVSIEPAAPGPDTLVKLRVKLANSGEKVASQLGFRITINGQELPVYRNHLFMFPVPAGGSEELQLFNFWTTETSRPMPADGKLALEVTLTEARWFDITMEKEGEEEVEVWTPTGDVPGLPSSRSLSLDLKKAAAGSSG